MQNNLAFTAEEFGKQYKVNFSKLLGKGHDANVFQVIDKNQNLYALKCLAQASEQNAINLFNEINILVHIQHPHIVKMLGYSQDFSCLLLEYMCHGSLHKILLAGPLPIAIANGILSQLAEALDYLHQKGVTHGDIKLDNLLVSEDYKVKLCDFGFAKVNGQTPIPKNNTICGSEGFSAPEIYTIPQDLKKCDIFSLGVVYFIMVTGRPPFESNSPENTDDWWSCIENGEWDTYWKESKLALPQDLKQHIQMLLCADPKGRISLDSLRLWLAETAGSPDQIREELEKRLK